MKGFLSHVLSGRNLFRSEIEWFRSNDRLQSNVFHRLVVHTFAVSTVTTALLTNTQARNAIGRQTFSADLYTTESRYIRFQTGYGIKQGGEKKEKKNMGEKGTKKCRRQSYKHQNHCPVYSYFSSNLCVYWQRSETKLCKNKYTIFEWWRAVRNIVGNEIYVTHRFTSICIHEFVSFIFGEKKTYLMQNRSRYQMVFFFLSNY